MPRIRKKAVSAGAVQGYALMMPDAIVNGGKISYQERGAGLPIVLIHGFPLDGRVFDDQLAGLSDSFRVIVPDLPGFGRSAPAQAFTMRGLAADLRAFLKQIGALPCVLGGLSMGGYVVLPMAEMFPADLKGLILLDTRAEADTDEARQNRDRMAAAARERGAAAVVEMMFGKMLAQSTAHQRPHVAQKLRQVMSEQPVDAIVYALAAMRDREDFRPRLGSIQTPTLIVVGEYDAITPPANAETMRSGLPRGWLITIPDSGHMPVMEQPESVNEAIRRFIRELR